MVARVVFFGISLGGGMENLRGGNVMIMCKNGRYYDCFFLFV